MITLHEGDNRETLRRLIKQGVRVHSVVTDPPYGLVNITKRFGKDGSAPAKHGRDGAFARQSAGFMGSKWDGTGIERDPEFWALIWEILLPGGYCIAFSGSRTGHWQACAMEMAGFVMHPMTGWAFGSGFPKDHDAAKAIDRELGFEPTVIGTAKFRDIRNGHDRGYGDGINAGTRSGPVQYIDHKITTATTATTVEAAQWEGWAYGTQSLKPAFEPIYIGQKPFSEKNGALNLLKHGVGAVNIDGCRVTVTDADQSQMRSMDRNVRSSDDGYGMNGSQSEKSVAVLSPQGRHPANLLHDGSDAVVALFPDSKGQQAAVKGTEPSRTGDDGTACYNQYSGNRPEAAPRNDSGSAARFFNCFPPDAEALYYHAKASKRDRITQCNICGEHGVGKKPSCGCIDPNTGKASVRTHPTVKPTGLIEHLVKLVTPPGGVVLDPFAGTGTTGAAARNLGFDCILMEADADYVGDIRARLSLPPPIMDPEIAALLGDISPIEAEIEALLG